jgi:hypothetical protein
MVNYLQFWAFFRPAKWNGARTMFSWEAIPTFGSLRERDCFLAWMQAQIAADVAKEIEAPAGAEAGERWFRHISTGSIWRVVSVENPQGPGFWPAYDEAA